MIEQIADWTTLIALALALWMLAWTLWQRTFTWDRLSLALTIFIAVKAIFWTWVIAITEWPTVFFNDVVRWGFRVALIAVSVWVIYEVRRLPPKGKTK